MLLWGGGDALAFNDAELLPLDVADPAAPAWATLEQELRWRTCLQVHCSLISEWKPHFKPGAPAGGGR